MLQKKGGAIGHTYTERIRREDTNIHSLHFVTIRYIYTLKKAGAITHTHTDTQRGYNCSKVQMYIAHYVLLHFHTLCFVSLKELKPLDIHFSNVQNLHFTLHFIVCNNQLDERTNIVQFLF